MKKFTILSVFALALFIKGAAQTCDTITNLVSNLDTPSVLVAEVDSPDGGYISGNNLYGDIAKAEMFNVDSGFYLISATFNFGYVAINSTDTNSLLTVYAWDTTGTDGSGTPGNAFDSTYITLGQIAMAVTAGEGLRVYFTGDSLIQGGVIFAGIMLPAVTGDTIALLTNTYAGPDGMGWEETIYGWNTYSSDWNDSIGSLGNYITIGVCNSVPGDTPAVNFSLGLNPANGCNPNTAQFVDLSQSNPAPNSWTWYFGDGGTSNAQNPVYQYPDSGSYGIAELVTNNTGSVIQVFVPAFAAITIYNSPVITPVITPVDSTGTGSITIDVTGGTGYYFATWNTGAQGDALVGVVPGTYIVSVLDQDNCTTVDTIILPAPTSVIQISNSQWINLFPNPTSNILNVTSDKDISGYVVQLYDATGRMVANQTLEGISNVMNIAQLSAGVYTVRIVNRQNTIVAKDELDVVK